MADGYLGTESRDLRFCSISLEGLDSNARLTDFISLKSEISINPAVTLALIHVRGTKIKETQQNRACHSPTNTKILRGFSLSCYYVPLSISVRLKQLTKFN